MRQIAPLFGVSPATVCRVVRRPLSAEERLWIVDGTLVARVEHAIGRMKNRKILRNCRRHGDGLHHAAQAVAQLHNLAYAA